MLFRSQEKIRTETKDFNALNEFEKFILNRGYLYDTEEELKAGYDRAWKASHGIMVTAEEFAAEIKSRVKWDKELNVSPLYEVLSRLVKEKKLKPGDVFQYAVYTWCLRNPKNSGEEGRDIYKGKDYLRGGRSAGLLFSVGKLRGGDYYKGLHREKDLDLVCILADGSQLERSLYMLADFAVGSHPQGYIPDRKSVV